MKITDFRGDSSLELELALETEKGVYILAILDKIIFGKSEEIEQKLLIEFRKLPQELQISILSMGLTHITTQWFSRTPKYEPIMKGCLFSKN